MIEDGAREEPEHPHARRVGELADAVGHAYGLAGDHRQWATTPQQELGRQIAQSLARIMAAKPAPLDVAADPFATPIPTTLPMGPGPDGSPS